MSPNALLIRWKYGYTQVTTGAADLHYGYLELGSVQTEAEALRLGRAELNRTGGPKDQISVGADPDPVNAADAYGTGWNLGDYVVAPTRDATGMVLLADQNGETIADQNGETISLYVGGPQRVLQVSVTEDDNGALTVLPELSSLIDQREVRWQRTLNRMAGGSLDGSSAVASPIITPEYVPGRRPTIDTQTFSWNPLTTERTSPWKPDVMGRLAQVKIVRGRSNPPVASDVAGEVRIAFIVNGVTLDEAIIWDGDEEGKLGGTGVEFGPADKLELEPTIINGLNVTATVLHTHYH